MALWAAKGEADVASCRQSSDEFYTPPEALQILIPYLPRRKRIWECAWGKGHIAKYLRQHGFRVVGRANQDFLKTDDDLDCDLLVSNPPYSLKNDFLSRAYALGKPFAFLLPVDVLFGVDRHPMFVKYGAQLLIPNKRIHFISETGESCNFNTIWVCWKLLPQDIIFAELQ